MLKLLKSPATGDDSRQVPGPRHGKAKPHVIYLAIGFPPAAKSCAYRMRETANQFVALGWDVTVLTLRQDAWERDYGLDHTLSEGVDPSVRVVELDLAREDLETDIRRYSAARALHPQKWLSRYRKHVLEIFPEPMFGDWRFPLEKALLKAHREHPADLLMTTLNPYVNIAATCRLWDEARVPYVVDFRDGWSVDVIGGGEAFAKDSVSGKWEQRLLANALQIWCVNDPIADFYRQRFPKLADRVRVVRNGYDAESVPDHHESRDLTNGLTFGYLGSVNFSADTLDTVLIAWRMARHHDPLIAKSRFEVRGHIGSGANRGVNAHSALLAAAAEDGVTFGGPVSKGEVKSVYDRWDALVLVLVGGVYVTSGKVYEVAASGLPIVSAHEVNHDASTVLAGHPLWTGAVGLHSRALADSFSRAAHMALDATPEDRERALEHARQYLRSAQLAPAIKDVTEMVRPRATAATGEARS
jgi:glycosyltransferase involved in cell wall biosynthesis